MLKQQQEEEERVFACCMTCIYIFNIALLKLHFIFVKHVEQSPREDSNPGVVSK